MALRVCAERGCPVLVKTTAYKGLCDTHRRARDRARGTREDRGYDASHRAERARIQQLIDAGITIRCVTCNRPLDLNFHLGHTDDRTGWIGPQCPHCNDSAAGKASHQ